MPNADRMIQLSKGMLTGGAGGTIGSARAAAAPPDGYTLLAAAMGSHVAAPVLTPNVKYDPVVDCVPIGITAHSPAVVIARKDFPAQDLKEFIAVLRQRGDALKEAHGGTGASSHMACLLFTAEIGAKPTLVAYRGSGPGLNDLVGGHVDFMCEQSVSVAESVLAGSVKAYAVSAGERLAMLPNVPTAREAGVNYEMSVWAGLFAPKGVPPEVIARLADTVDKALDEPAVRETLAKLGGSIPAKAERWSRPTRHEARLTSRCANAVQELLDFVLEVNAHLGQRLCGFQHVT